ncbi:hypothetical protein Rhow_002392 [Rhodococcus wratislaviensis]|uniref:Uncharacterized protein n=1 Tax=Rhodococcus wratislaviensis TaxID=44752 RepID=A0A402C5N2_RHOWR|nr:hypothetical protein Rhow_002392 [Rhodococcus wratislaviensis]
MEDSGAATVMLTATGCSKVAVMCGRVKRYGAASILGGEQH